MTQELWRDIPGYEGMYIVSNTGKVMSLPRTRMFKGERRPLSGRMLKQSVTPNGYAKVTLFKNGQSKQVSVHRIVMLAFVGPSDLQVNHRDENKLNNNLDNLEYMSGLENTRYTCCKPVESYDLETGKTIKVYEGASDTRADGYAPGAVSSVCLKKYGYNSHHRVGWRFSSVEHCGEDSASCRTHSVP